VSHVFRLIVGGVKIVYAALEAGVHDSEVLIGKRHIDNHVGLMAAKQLYQLLHTVSIDSVGAHVGSADCFSHGVALRLGARCYHYLIEHLGVLGALVGHYCTHTTCADDYYFRHFGILLLF